MSTLKNDRRTSEIIDDMEISEMNSTEVHAVSGGTCSRNDLTRIGVATAISPIFGIAAYLAWDARCNP